MTCQIEVFTYKNTSRFEKKNKKKKPINEINFKAVLINISFHHVHSKIYMYTEYDGKNLDINI